MMASQSCLRYYRKPRALLRFCQFAVLALLLAACSRIQLAYNNLDWLLTHHLATYMPLSDDQDSLLEVRVNHFLHWHCSTQISAYAHLLREANSRFQSGDLSRAELENFNQRIEKAWADILQQAGPSIADILVTADESQVQTLFKGFDTRNAKWLKKFEGHSAEDLRRDYQARMGKELRRWFGKLDKQQRQILAAWSEQFQPLGLQGLEIRQRWQSRLQTLMNSRDDHDAFRREFARLLSNPGELHTPSYLQRTQHNRAVTIDMLYAVIRQLSDKQKQHLQHQVNSITEDFDSLACRGETMAAS